MKTYISDTIRFPGTKVHWLPRIRLSDYTAHQLAYTLVKKHEVTKLHDLSC